LAGILEAQDRDIERRASEAAATCAQRGDVAITRLRYREAAAHFAAAASRVPLAHESERIRYLARQAAALYSQGNEFGDKPSLQLAAEAWRALLALSPRARAPLDWASIQNNIGNVLGLLGDRGDDDALPQAVSAYQAALLEYTRERDPLDWATIQNNLGSALQRLGERGDDNALHRAVEAHQAALLEVRRERAPLIWAMIQNNLANMFQLLGERGDDDALH
jgi:tetratricopeptide (TPR) repeat protein